MKKNIISMAAAMAVLSACGPGVPQLGKSSLDEVIGAMTLEEKAHLVVGTGMVPPDCVSTPSVRGIRLRTIVLISLSELCSPLPGTRNWWKV